MGVLMKLCLDSAKIEYLQSILDSVISNAQTANDVELTDNLLFLRQKVGKGSYYNFNKHDIYALLEFSESMLKSFNKLREDLEKRDFPEEEKQILRDKADQYKLDLGGIVDFLQKANGNYNPYKVLKHE